MIISASRRTDIPAFYSEWFINRLKAGFIYVKNPFNAQQISKINLSPEIIECIVFWTKNPEKMLPHLRTIDDLEFPYYFQFTVTSYDTSIEQYVPKKNQIISTFIKLSDQIGPDKVIWRYDPILISDIFTIEYHLKWFNYLAKRLQRHTKKCVISFFDMYKKCEHNLKNINIKHIEMADKLMLANELLKIANSYNLSLQTCAEETALTSYELTSGKCIDDGLISKIIGSPIAINPDKSQRPTCRCTTSIDIGTYNTCGHGCKYCYANFSPKSAAISCSVHDKSSPLLIGNITGKEKINLRKMNTSIRRQQTLF